MPLCLHYCLLGIIIRPILFPTYINLLPDLRRMLRLTTYITPIATNAYSCDIPLDKLILLVFTFINIGFFIENYKKSINFNSNTIKIT